MGGADINAELQSRLGADDFSSYKSFVSLVNKGIRGAPSLSIFVVDTKELGRALCNDLKKNINRPVFLIILNLFQ